MTNSKKAREMEKENEKSCKYCGEKFVATSNHQLYCSAECQVKQNDRKEYIKKMDRLETIKEIAQKAKAKRDAIILSEPVISNTSVENSLPNTDLVEYIKELDHDLDNLNKSTENMMQIIKENKLKSLWLNQHIDRLKHIISASDKEQNDKRQ